MSRPIEIYSREELRNLTAEQFSAEEVLINQYKELISAVKVFRQAPVEIVEVPR